MCVFVCVTLRRSASNGSVFCFKYVCVCVRVYTCACVIDVVDVLIGMCMYLYA